MPPSPSDPRPGPAAIPASPLVIAVPHAGRDYPPALCAATRLPIELLEPLEDRHAEQLVAGLADAGAAVFVARHARAWIDLNRSPRELDPAMVRPSPAETLPSARVRGGLGLVPRRVAGAGEIYREPLALADVVARIAQDHAPWHAAIDAALARARARFGVAILIDCHSMPPLPSGGAQLVLGDRFGRSAGPALLDAAERACAHAGVAVARNAPYAGGYTLERHGRPAAGIHAVQLEFCRTLYLDESRRAVGPGLPLAQALLAQIARAMIAAALPELMAAE